MNSKNSRGNEVEEDVPQYRSVMITGPLSAPPMPRSFASMGPAKMAPRSMQQSKPHTSQTTIWNVAELPSMPAAYFLERTNVYVVGNPQEIADRICDSLRMASIAAQCGEDDKNLLNAETSDALRFAVRLFADQGKIVVEVQRKSGCSYQFREAARSVLRSAKGLKISAKKKFSLPSCIPRQSPKDQQQRAEDGFRVALRQLNSNMRDSQLIGMESLEQLTRSEYRSAASLKIFGECIDKILNAIQLDADDASSDIEERHFTMMKRRSLTVLANALNSLSQANELEGLLKAYSHLTSNVFISTLVDTLADSANSPHEATQAAKCIQELMIDSEVKKQLIEMSTSSIVASACSSGACRSVLLEDEAKKLQQHLNSSVCMI